MLLSEKKIDTEMARQELTRIELAKRADISRGRLTMILNVKNVQPATAGRIARALGVDVTEILAD